MSSSGPPDSPQPIDHDRVPARRPGPRPLIVPEVPDSDNLLPDPMLTPTSISVPGQSFIDAVHQGPSFSRPPGPSLTEEELVVSSGPDSPDVIPLDVVPSFRTIDPLCGPPPSFEEVPPTPPRYQEQLPLQAPIIASGGAAAGAVQSRFTLPTWQEVQAASQRLRLRVRIGGPGSVGDDGTKKRKRDRAKQTAKECWRKLGLGKKEDRDDEDTQSPGRASPVTVVPTVVHIKK